MSREPEEETGSLAARMEAVGKEAGGKGAFGKVDPERLEMRGARAKVSLSCRGRSQRIPVLRAFVHPCTSEVVKQGECLRA